MFSTHKICVSFTVGLCYIKKTFVCYCYNFKYVTCEASIQHTSLITVTDNFYMCIKYDFFCASEGVYFHLEIGYHNEHMTDKNCICMIVIISGIRAS